MKRLSIYIGISIVLAITFVYTFSENSSDYEVRVKKHWKERELYLLNTTPPLIDHELSTFKPRDDFRVIAKIEHIHFPKKIELATNDNETRKYTEYCLLHFSLQERSFSLKVLKPEDNSELFLAFSDQTTGKETYGAGRFLDVEFKPNAVNTVIDFNYAYNPYCAYNSRYSCPLPLPENHLPVRIEAGEKNYKKGQ